MASFEQAIGVLLADEGPGYVANDHGRGPSKYGITLATYRELHPGATAADIAGLDVPRATAFYLAAFWERYRLGRISDQGLATAVLDLGAVEGMGTVIRALQAAAGMPAQACDGVLGPASASAVNARRPDMLRAGLRARIEAHYRAIVADRPEWAGCLPGWLSRLAKRLA